jgi:hypothetical protein
LCGQRRTRKSLADPSLSTRFVIWPIRVDNDDEKSGRADLPQVPTSDIEKPPRRAATL